MLVASTDGPVSGGSSASWTVHPASATDDATMTAKARFLSNALAPKIGEVNEHRRGRTDFVAHGVLPEERHIRNC
jgi:hypothetical protein